MPTNYFYTQEYKVRKDHRQLSQLKIYSCHLNVWESRPVRFCLNRHNFAAMFVFIPYPLKTQKLHRVVVNGIDGWNVVNTHTSCYFLLS